MRPSKEMNFKFFTPILIIQDIIQDMLAMTLVIIVFRLQKQHEKQTTHMDPFCSEVKNMK